MGHIGSSASNGGGLPLEKETEEKWKPVARE